MDGVAGWGTEWKTQEHERVGHVKELAGGLIYGLGCLWATVGERPADAAAR